MSPSRTFGRSSDIRSDLVFGPQAGLCSTNLHLFMLCNENGCCFITKLQSKDPSAAYASSTEERLLFGL